MKTMRTLLYTSMIALPAIFFSCKGSDTIITEGNCAECQEAVIRYYGDPALDGCGFVVEIDSVVYMATNLPKEYQDDGMVVELKYDLTEDMRCGMVQMYKGMSIKEIRKKQ